MFSRERYDTARAYMSYDFECADYLIGSGIVDRDMGGKKGDELMKEFLHKFWLPLSLESKQGFCHLHNAGFSCMSEVRVCVWIPA